ncbi:MAG: hypothetical protein ACYCYK_13875 [Candidatus Dormibacteria bacterium]
MITASGWVAVLATLGSAVIGAVIGLAGPFVASWLRAKEKDREEHGERVKRRRRLLGEIEGNRSVLLLDSKKVPGAGDLQVDEYQRLRAQLVSDLEDALFEQTASWYSHLGSYTRDASTGRRDAVWAESIAEEATELIKQLKAPQLPRPGHGAGQR